MHREDVIEKSRMFYFNTKNSQIVAISVMRAGAPGHYSGRRLVVVRGVEHFGLGHLLRALG